MKALGVLFFVFGFFGHLVHKYFLTDQDDHMDRMINGPFSEYLAGHWYFWVSAILGIVLLNISDQKKTPEDTDLD